MNQIIKTNFKKFEEPKQNNLRTKITRNKKKKITIVVVIATPLFTILMLNNVVFYFRSRRKQYILFLQTEAKISKLDFTFLCRTHTLLLKKKLRLKYFSSYFQKLKI